MAIKTRKPTGAVPWPLILLEGGEKAGKSWSAAEFSASEKVGQTYWIDLNEGAADEYGAIPGTRYLVVEHNGTWADIVAQVAEIRQEACRAADAGEPPVVLVIDSMTAEWDLLKDWVTNRAKGSPANQKRLAADPSAEVKAPMNLWNDATARHRRLMTMLMTFPGIVVMTARGKEVASMDASGRPIEGSKEYKVEGHKTLGYDASVWVRLSREHPPIVVSARSVHVGIRPGVDRPVPAPNFTLEWLVFDVLKCDPTVARVRDLTEIKPGSESPDLDTLSDAAKQLLSEAEDAANVEALRLVWTAINPLLKSGEIVTAEAEFVNQRIQHLSQQMTAESNGAAA
ncbi:AAA family ATPase [Nonomuraea guangzhouensis]|uniref:AAA family ATPase n=1 Tax=Nonomuraea guangzhouensis TaxID=1291555 RepID=A0ABW4GX34_9ACTN|nr:AAA family ATPase [Nonomuraea guangzhouensis]